MQNFFCNDLQKKNILLFIIEKIFKRNNSYNGNSDELTHHLKLTETKLHNTLQKYAYSKFKCFCPTRTVWKLMAHITRNSSSIICNGIKCKARIVPLFTFQFSTHILIFSRCKYSIWKLNFWPITIAFVNLRWYIQCLRIWCQTFLCCIHII